MSGDNQHFIPRLYIKGFRIRGVGGGKQAWVFRSGVGPELKYLNDIAADEHFYSPPAPGSLDDVITKYEHRLADHFKILRKAPIGPFADAGVPAEVIAHLTIRTESMRTGISFGTKQMALTLLEKFQDEEIVRRIFSLDGDVPDERFKRILTNSLAEYETQLKILGLSPEAAQRIAFVVAKERFPQAFKEMRPTVAAFSVGMYQKADEMIAAAQRSALTRSIVPEDRVNFLKELRWEIKPVAEAAILPDCVAITLEADGRPRPLLLSDRDDIEAIVLPLDYRRLLIGRKSPEVEVYPFMFNLHAASCSESFFVSSERTDKLDEWAKYVGVVSRATMLTALKGVFEEYNAPALPVVSSITGPASMSLTFKDGYDQATAEAVGEKVKSVLAWTAGKFSLDRIDQITFANDVANEASLIDRGFEDEAERGAPPQNIAGKTISSLRDEKVHMQIVLRNDVASALLMDPDGPEWACGIFWIVYTLAEANCAIEFDKAFPGIMLRPHVSLFNVIRYEPVSTAWTGYISSRFSSPFWPDGVPTKRRLLKQSIANVKEALPQLGARFATHQNHGLLIKEVSPYLTYILVHSAALAGLADALGLDILADEEVIQIFREINLAEWYVSYVGDLRSIWEKRGQWRSEKEFMALSRHTERLLWQCGMVLSEGPDNDCRIEFPNIAAFHQWQRTAAVANSNAP